MNSRCLGRVQFSYHKEMVISIGAIVFMPTSHQPPCDKDRKRYNLDTVGSLIKERVSKPCDWRGLKNLVANLHSWISGISTDHWVWGSLRE